MMSNLSKKQWLTLLQTAMNLISVVLLVRLVMFWQESQQIRHIHEIGDLASLEFIDSYQKDRGVISNTPIEQGEYRDPFSQEGEYADPYAVVEQAVYIAQITIPSINVNEQVYIGTSPSLLTYGVGLVQGSDIPSSLPGTNTLIAGHRGYVGVSNFFYHIPKLSNGDLIYIKTSQEELVYRVTGQQIVKPHEVNKVQVNYKKSLLTLVTCTPMYSWSDRLLVEAELVG